MDKDKFFMLEALKEAKKAFDIDEVPVGCVLVHGNRIIARAHNQVEKLTDATAHGEMICLTSGSAHFNDWRLKDTILYTTLEPCIMCSGAIINARVKKVVWAAKDLRVGANGSFIDVFEKKHPIHEVEIESGVLEEISSNLLREFFQKARKSKLNK
ncbi:MAG: tRNA-specific adenosine deaminase [Candidatus Anoxychlamydiales bacterium]|nr:tRNA-specific adenosine deaminase [Candidatus Anoxychlamydiales bacterium]NGX52009.1 tRNA-specific adenosine deaminase [Candidatus Anoxychlamydiales bacterium]